MKDISRNSIKFSCIILIYLCYFIASSIFQSHYNLIIPRSKITVKNLPIRFISDLLNYYAPSILIFVLFRRRLNLRINRPAVLSGSIYLAMFLYHGNFTLTGFYIAVFYFFVAFCEEILFRGVLPSFFDKANYKYSVIIIGLIWGSLHALSPIILNHYPFKKAIIKICSELLGGVVSHYLFSLTAKIGKTLWLAIWIHAILDYSSIVFP